MIRPEYFKASNLANIPNTKIQGYKESAPKRVVLEKRTYTTTFGDTFYSLSEKVFGNESFWTIIADINSPNLAMLSQLPVGEIIFLPKMVG